MQKEAVAIDGSRLAESVKAAVREEIHALGKSPSLAVILVGSNPASKVYVERKEVACGEVGIISQEYRLEESVPEEALLSLIRELNENRGINGILVQLPLPQHINEGRVIAAIHPKKDVDGLHPANMGKLLRGEEGMLPCTPKGIIRMLESTGVALAGKRAVVVGRSSIVGKPAALLLLRKDMAVTLCHSKMQSLGRITGEADVLVVAVGKPMLITAEMVKEGAVVIDVGVNRTEDRTRKSGYRICGDVDFDRVKYRAAYLSPVPGGVGPMTVAMLMENVLSAYKDQNGIRDENG